MRTVLVCLWTVSPEDEGRVRLERKVWSGTTVEEGSWSPVLGVGNKQK